MALGITEFLARQHFVRNSHPVVEVRDSASGIRLECGIRVKEGGIDVGHEVARDGGAALGELDPLSGKVREFHHDVPLRRPPSPSPGSKNDVQFFGAPHSINLQSCIVVNKNGRHTIRNCR